ncbi:hypothetical protein MY10362_002190 [Beauveria mimosiformis]
MSKNSDTHIEPELTDEPESYVPDGQVQDNSAYVTRAKEPVPVQGNDAAVEDLVSEFKANSGAQLGESRVKKSAADSYCWLPGRSGDEDEATDEFNMVKGRTRGAKPRTAATRNETTLYK